MATPSSKTAPVDKENMAPCGTLQQQQQQQQRLLQTPLRSISNQQQQQQPPDSTSKAATPWRNQLESFNISKQRSLEEWITLFKEVEGTKDIKLMERMFGEALDKQLESPTLRSQQGLVHLWLMRVRLEERRGDEDERKSFLQFMKIQGIGKRSASYYLEFARSQPQKAEKILKEGLDYEAQPLDLLKQAHSSLVQGTHIDDIYAEIMPQIEVLFIQSDHSSSSNKKEKEKEDTTINNNNTNNEEAVQPVLTRCNATASLTEIPAIATVTPQPNRKEIKPLITTSLTSSSTSLTSSSTSLTSSSVDKENVSSRRRVVRTNVGGLGGSARRVVRDNQQSVVDLDDEVQVSSTPTTKTTTASSSAAASSSAINAPTVVVKDTEESMLSCATRTVLAPIVETVRSSVSSEYSPSMAPPRSSTSSSTSKSSSSSSSVEFKSEIGKKRALAEADGEVLFRSSASSSATGSASSSSSSSASSSQHASNPSFKTQRSAALGDAPTVIQSQQQQQQQPSSSQKPPVAPSISSSSSSSLPASQQPKPFSDATKSATFVAENLPPWTGEIPANCIAVNGRPYQKLLVIGEGGNGKVFKVNRLPDGAEFAMKRIKIKKGNDADLELIKNEIELLLRLRGKPNIITLYDYCFQGSYVYMVMEYGDYDLAHGLYTAKQNNTPITVNVIRSLWKKMLRSVDIVHQERVIHGDLKPANFLFVKDDLKLIDFGIAKSMGHDTTNIVRETAIGTLNYMAPEAFQRDECLKLGRSSDVWSLGCILYQIVYGKTPYHHYTDTLAKIMAITNDRIAIEYPPISLDEPGSEYLIDVIKMCLQRKSSDRASIAQLLQHPFLPQPTPVPAEEKKFVVSSSTFESLVRLIRQSNAKDRSDNQVAGSLYQYMVDQCAIEGSGISIFEAKPTPSPPPPPPPYNESKSPNHNNHNIIEHSNQTD